MKIFDNGGKTIDRYTLLVDSVNEPGRLDMYGFNDAPYHPQGFGQFAGTYAPMESYGHLGELISYRDLPDQAQRYVKEIITTPLPGGYGQQMVDPETGGVMQIMLAITCKGCSEEISHVYCDTADGAQEVGQVVLDAAEYHRDRCEYYGRDKCKELSRTE